MVTRNAEDNRLRTLWQQRKHAPPDADVWDLRFHWQKNGHDLFRRVTQGTYRLRPMLCFRTRHGERLAQWSAADALVLKWLALQVDGRLPVHERCEHRKHTGGVRASVRRLHLAVTEEEYRFVYRTDIRGYYRHIRKAQAYSQFCRYIAEPVLQDLFRQYLYYSVEDGGEIYTPETGIARGCSLSLLVGGVCFSTATVILIILRGFIMHVTWMTSWFLPARAGSFAAASGGLMNTLISVASVPIRTKHTSVGYAMASTGWVSALMKRGPPA